MHAGPALHLETGMSYDSSAPRPARPPRGHQNSFAQHVPDPAAAEPLRGGASPRAWTGHHRDLRILRRAYRRQRRVTTFAVLGCFTLFLGLAAGCPGLMNRPVTGGLSAAWSSPSPRSPPPGSPCSSTNAPPAAMSILSRAA